MNNCCIEVKTEAGWVDRRYVRWSECKDAGSDERMDAAADFYTLPVGIQHQSYGGNITALLVQE